jgi:hypothetical protein
MPRKAAKSVPGTERYRDERRKGGGPRMHGGTWHDHEQPHELERVSDSAGEASTEGESGGARTGMGARRVAARPAQSKERRKRTTPVGKGRTKKTRAAKGSQSGHRAKGRA